MLRWSLANHIVWQWRQLAAVDAHARKRRPELRRALGVDWNPFEPTPAGYVRHLRPAKPRKVEAAWREELASVPERRLHAAELDEARRGLLSARALGRAQDLQLAGQLTSNLHLGRRFAFDQAIDEQIGKLTLEQVNGALRKYIDPSKIVYAWGGDFKQP